MDQSRSFGGGRYGGVLRAPMKFVGPKTFSETGLDNTPTGGNPAAEWNPSTGVFVANPDNDTTQTVPVSGVINYLNKFGRTGTVPGRYKIYDAVGELYGEALRYLQGLGPTAEAVSNITASMSDGFPVYTNWTDPYGGSRSSTADYSCLKSNIVMIGDVNSHDSDRLFTRTANLADNLPDFSGNNTSSAGWQTVVNKFEANISGNYLDGQNASRTIGNFNTANSQLQTNSSGTPVLTGQAYWAHTHDIRGRTWTNAPTLQRPGLRVKSFFFDVNENGSSTLTASGTASTDNYRRRQNQFFTAAKYGGFESDASNVGNKPYNTYGNPFKQQDGTNNNDVWQDPARPGEASTYYLQSSARGVLNAFDSIFSRAASNARSIAGSAASNRNITQSGSTVYQAAFDTLDWSGDVLSIPLNVSTTNVVTAGTTPNWSASTRLNAMTTPSTTRNIFMGREGASSNPTATNFAWTALDATTQTKLQKLTPVAANDGLGSARVSYLRGDRSQEGSPFRIRTKLLGDIINSGVVYSGAPNTSIAGTGYSTFYSNNATRTPAVFVGANDGMLHAFNATTGDELFGYIPSWMGTKLAALTSSTYNTNHQLYVDSTPVVAEAQVGSAGTFADWKTVLVSGTGGGGAGVFALDVTNPSTFAASNVMWEFTQADDADLGYVVGKPQIVKMRTSAYGASPATYKWFAMVASGVNSYVPNPVFGNTYGSGNPALFLLALDKPAGTAWTSGGTSPNYYKVSLPFNATLGTSKPTGLINFRPVFQNTGEVAQVYMGDLHGNMWKLDFSSQAATNWNLNNLSPYKDTATVPQAVPLYIAKTGGTTPTIQPISMAPSIVAGARVGGVETRYVLFGTGKYLEPADKSSTNQNTFYAIYENGNSATDSASPTSVVSGRGRLQVATFDSTLGTVSAPGFVLGRPASDTDTTTRAGWYLDFPTSGERLVNGATVIGNKLNFGSLIPSAAGAAGSCSATGGSGREYELNIDTANGVSATSTVGLLGESLILEIDSATSYTTSNTTGRRIKTTVKQVVQQGSTGINPSRTVTVDSIAGRLSWRQINNYQDLKSAP